MTQPDPRSFADPLVQLEAEIAAAEARGEPLPEQAYLMLAKLRELMDALRALDATLGPAAGAEPAQQREPGGEGTS